MKEILLKNPGLVENAPDETSCFHACIQMLMRTRGGAHVCSFDEIDAIQKRPKGYYSWEYPMLEHLSREGFECKMICAFSLDRFVREGASYVVEYFGEESAKDQLDHTADLSVVIDSARRFLASATTLYEMRVPTLEDIRDAISGGWYVIPVVNQKILQADQGFAMHSLFLYGFSERGVRMHNPGPPATEASEVAWDMFDKAWSSPKESSRQIILARAG